ncbi:alpha-1,2-mannosyltransferase ALG9 [Caerostris darwini]|uniref:Mannosyltransferase n=1 Tax=Caerostris darwini TaxID=1538125 RepID=A0AAV4QXK3_9ARAC|nr:alpha-1,2-mannosyltransferase ALG9 [Caerostris darwini]
MPARTRQPAKSRREIARERNAPIEYNPVINEEFDGEDSNTWMPSTYTSFKLVLSLRLCAAVWSNISDCDEVYNYWEPLHYLLYGKGFQTWEYSPLYAIRSYAYVWLHALPCCIYDVFFQTNKVFIFYYLRCLLALCCTMAEVYFYRGVCQHFGQNIGRLVITFLILSSGMFLSAAAFLPSSFAMYLSTAAVASWFMQDYKLAILFTAASTLVGWPFAALLGLPIAYDLIILKKNPVFFLKWSLIVFFLIAIPLIYVDSLHFGKFVFAPLNIVLYNVFTSHGPDLYGTEPCTFYFLNGFLNMNIVFLAALFSIPALFALRTIEGVQRKVSDGPPFYLCLSPLYLWMLVFFPLAHKEERFLFPIYPMICLAGAFTVDAVQKMYHYVLVKRRFTDYLDYTSWISLSFCTAFCIISLSRTIILYKGYHAPIETFVELNKISIDEDKHPLPPEYPVNVCMGKEWYRFPSSFFLPDNWQLKYLKSEFKGQLPKPYSNLPNATKIIPTDMNDQNLEEPSRYVDIKNCDYIVDSDYPNHSSLEPRYSRNPKWNKIYSLSFLDGQRSHPLLRAFYIPYFTDYFCNNNDVVDAFLNISNSKLQVYNILRIFYFPERTPYFNCLSLNKAVTFSHQVHGSGTSVAYLQYRRGTPVNHRGGGGIGTVPSALIVLRSSGDHF